MNRDKLKEIYTKYNLDKDDIFMLKFGSKQTPVIRRSGVEKIQAHLNIEVNFTLREEKMILFLLK